MPAVLAHRRHSRSACPEWTQYRPAGEEATLKRVFLFADHIELRAENPTFPTILRIGEDMNTITIEGKAVGLCRDCKNSPALPIGRQG